MATNPIGIIEVHLVDVVSFQKVADIIEAGKLMAEELWSMEWVDAFDGFGPRCPSCDFVKSGGEHDNTCGAQIALAAWKEISEGDE